MQSAIETILDNLQAMLAAVQKLQSRYQAEILALQSITNTSLKAVPAPRSVVQMQEKEVVVPTFSMESKINALLSEVEQQKKIIESEQKPKIEIKPEVIVEKKPPLPKVNLSEKAVKNAVPAYQPPRGKNEVTGKVTQTTIRTSAQKVFRPDKTKTSLSKEPPARNNSQSRVPTKVEEKKEMPKPQPVKVEVPKAEPVRTHVVKQEKKEVAVQPKKEVVERKEVVRLARFDKPQEEVMEALIGRGPTNRKGKLEQMLKECQNEQKGHRTHEQTSRLLFIKHACNYTGSRFQVLPQTTHQIWRKQWQYDPLLFEMSPLLDKLQQDIEGLLALGDCRIDPKQQYRLQFAPRVYNQTLQDISQTSQNGVPQQLDLTFSFKEQANAVELQPNNNEGNNQLNESLKQLLQCIQQKGSLQRPELRGLQVLSEVGIYRSRRSPMLAMRSEYTKWQEYYTKSQS